jgi:hypothetical protein
MAAVQSGNELPARPTALAAKIERNCQNLPAIRITPANFKNGTFEICSSGRYILSCDILFDPVDVCQTAAIAVLNTKRVIVDFNGHEIRQSVRHAAAQRFFSILKIEKSKYVWVRNGTLGRSSYRGLFAYRSHDLLLEYLKVQQFEVAGIELDRCQYVSQKRVDIGATRRYCWLTPAFGIALANIKATEQWLNCLPAGALTTPSCAVAVTAVESALSSLQTITSAVITALAAQAGPNNEDPPVFIWPVNTPLVFQNLTPATQNVAQGPANNVFGDLVTRNGFNLGEIPEPNSTVGFVSESEEYRNDFYGREEEEAEARDLSPLSSPKSNEDEVERKQTIKEEGGSSKHSKPKKSKSKKKHSSSSSHSSRSTTSTATSTTASHCEPDPSPPLPARKITEDVVLFQLNIHELTSAIQQVVGAYNNEQTHLQRDIAGFVVNLAAILAGPAANVYPPIGTNPLADLQLAVAFLYECLKEAIPDLSAPGRLSIEPEFANFAYAPPIIPTPLTFTYAFNIDQNGNQALGVVGLLVEKALRIIQMEVTIRVLNNVGLPITSVWSAPNTTAEYTGNNVHSALLMHVVELLTERLQGCELTSSNGHVRGVRVRAFSAKLDLRDLDLDYLFAGPAKSVGTSITIVSPNPVPLATALMIEPGTHQLNVANLQTNHLYGYGGAIPVWLGSSHFSAL